MELNQADEMNEEIMPGNREANPSEQAAIAASLQQQFSNEQSVY